MSVVLLAAEVSSERDRLEAVLRAGGFEVVVVSPSEIASSIAKVRPQAVLLAAVGTGCDALGTCRALRDDPARENLPFLAITEDDREVAAWFDAGADEQVAFSAPPALLYARLHRLIDYCRLTTMSQLNDQLLLVGRLLFGVIHEIRNPLGVIRGYTEMMQMTLGPDHETNRWTDPILRNAELIQLRLEHLMAAVRSGPARLEWQDLKTLVREAADLFLRGVDCRRGEVAIRTEIFEDLPQAQVDPGRLLQVLLNLLSNAQDAILEHGKAGLVVVRAEVDADAEDGPWIKIEVQDDGPGIPPAHLERIFEPYFTTKPTGSGYGLYLAREILREHGGRLTACNLETGGACFTIWLPTGPADEPAPAL